MALMSPKVIAQVSSSSATELAVMSWEWIMRADGQVFYRLTKVDGRRERNPWTLATRLPPAELNALRGINPGPLRCWTSSPASTGQNRRQEPADHGNATGSGGWSRPGAGRGNRLRCYRSASGAAGEPG